jgi:hypothetical protein
MHSPTATPAINMLCPKIDTLVPTSNGSSTWVVMKLVEAIKTINV